MMHSLIKNQAYVNGKWVDASDNKRLNVTNPANLSVVGEVPDMNAGDVQKAIDAAYETFHSKAWQNTTAKERSGLLRVSFHGVIQEMFNNSIKYSRNGSIFSRPTNKKSLKL